MDNRFIFVSTYSALNKLSVHYSTPYVSVTENSNAWIRRVAPIANVAKKGLIVVAVAVCTVATGIFSLCTLPYRLYQWNKIEFQNDLDLLTPKEQMELSKNIRNYIDQKEIEGKFHVPFSRKEKYVQKMMCSYARSSKIYGPIVAAWTEDLLKKANDSGKKIIFMARDGIAPYKVAKDMMKQEEYKKKYPNLANDDCIQLAYLSRKVIHHAKSSEHETNILQKYIQQLGIQPGDQCMFVDIGFQGSMIEDIRKMLPLNEIDFHYLISHTEKAEGFIYSKNDPRLEQDQFSQLPEIASIPYKGAGTNFATHWLEDSHQGVQESPKKLVEVNGIVYPNTKVPNDKQYVAPKGSLEYLLRKWTQKAIVQNWSQFSQNKTSLIDSVKKLDSTLNKIKNGDIMLIIMHK